MIHSYFTFSAKSDYFWLWFDVNINTKSSLNCFDIATGEKRSTLLLCGTDGMKGKNKCYFTSDTSTVHLSFN